VEALAPGLALRVRTSTLEPDIDVDLLHVGEVVDQARFEPDNDTRHYKFDWGPLKLDAELTVDLFGGEITASGELTAFGRVLFDRDDVELLHFSPAIGEIGGNSHGPAPVLDDPTFGKSRPCAPVPLRIFVEDMPRGLTDVGRFVKRAMFRGYPDFVFNTVACVGDFEEAVRGVYVKPGQRWFNVFLGYYQLDAPKRDWDRPFGYVSAEGADSEVAFEDVIRLGKSDWNFFSNWMYGTPTDAVRPYEPPAGTATLTGTEQIGDSLWHRVELREVPVVSAYESNAEGAGKLADNSAMTAVWRASFGFPNPQSDWDESFVGTTTDADIWMAYFEDGEAWHTVIFGGTGATGESADFIAAQMEANRAVMEEHYRALGFRTG
jgi:hypothetical protein